MPINEAARKRIERMGAIALAIEAAADAGDDPVEVGGIIARTYGESRIDQMREVADTITEAANEFYDEAERGEEGEGEED